MLSQFARKLKDGLARNTIRFANNRSGAFAPIFGVTAITLMLSAGAAFDYSQASRARSLMAASLDSAILAAGHELADGENRQQKLRKIFEDHLFANLTSHPQLAAATQIDSLEIDPLTGDVEASLKADMETAFLGLAGIPSLNLGVASAATFSSALSASLR